MSAREHPGDDRLIDLASHLLAPSAAPETIAHLETCPECEARFRSYCRDAELVRLRAPRTPRTFRWGLAAAAASILVAAVAIGVFMRDVPASEADAYWFPVESETVGLRTGAPSADEASFHDAVEAYRRRDAARVVALLSDRAIPEALDPLKIVLASAFVKAGEPRRAEELLAELRIETLPQPDRDRASWILYAAHRGTGNREAARRILEDLASRPGEFSEAARREKAGLR